jgi:uncharacterized protein
MIFSLVQKYKNHFMGFLKESSFSIKLFSLIGLMFAGITIGSLIGVLLIKPLFGIDVASDPSILALDGSDPSIVPVLKFIQFVQSVFFFIIPANIFAYWASNKNATDYLGFHHTKLPLYFFAALIILAAAPAIAGLAIWNENIHLPQFMTGIEEWIRSREKAAEKITELFLRADNTSALFINLLVIALVPALGEELIFRGILQKLLIEKTKSIHWGILITSVIFSAIHFQFLGFVPRLILGGLLGYLFVWSGSIWIPILVHFINNGSAVLADYLYKTQVTGIDLNKEENFSISVTLVSFLISFVLIWFFYKNRKIDSADGERLG